MIASEEEIVMVPVPRGRLQDVYDVLAKGAANTPGNGGSGDPLEVVALHVVLDGSGWLARELLKRLIREVEREDLRGAVSSLG